jgi:tRNA uridine 5-carbamoylmethylation protein Kti12
VKKLYMISGIPGSGKTTLAHQLAEQHTADVHSYDDLPGANTKESMDGSVKRAWLEAISADLKAGKSVVCDGLNLTRKDRKEVLSVVSDIPCKKVLVVKVVPLETCLLRNAQRKARLPDFVLEQSARKLEPPTPDEGWDEILISKEE